MLVAFFVYNQGMEITSFPFYTVFPGSVPDNGAVVRAACKDGRTVFLFTLSMPFLRRMGDEGDSCLELFTNGVWERYYLTGEGVQVLEHSSKRARARLRISIEGEVRDFKARFSGLALS